MPPVQIMMKPASGKCNMRCSYCFYGDLMSKRATPTKGMMDEGTLEVIVRKVIQYADRECAFVFQGGEPTLAGLSFYKALMTFQKKYNQKNIKIYNSIQTNGYGLDEEWIQFFKKQHFLVGISLDGFRELHDMNRKDANETGTYEKIMKTILLMKRYEVDFNVLTVVTSDTVAQIAKLYNFYRENQIYYLQFIPCIDAMDGQRGQADYSLSPKAYGYFLKIMFRLWYQDILSGKDVYIRYFANLIEIIRGKSPENCCLRGGCTRQYVAESDGSVYPCDFYVLESCQIGNFMTDTFAQMDQRRKALRFIEVSRSVDHDCQKCKWFGLCRGGCRRDREDTVGEKLKKNYYCDSYKSFFAYAYEKLVRLARGI